MNSVATVAGVGVHADVTQLVCPAGSAIIYDSRTYHRACPELNASGEERFAMLNCTTPSFVRDLSARNVSPAALFAFRTMQHRRWPQDKKESADDFIKSPVLGALTLREAKDVVRMVGDDEFGVERPEIKEAVHAAVSSETAKL